MTVRAASILRHRGKNWGGPFFPSLVFAVLAAGCGPTGLGADWHRVEPRPPAPSFTLTSVAGEPVSLDRLRGKIVVMEFWATWCGPCRFSLPSLELLAQRYAGRGVAVLLINQEEQREAVVAWLDDRYHAAKVLLDQDGAVGAAYQVQSIPRLFVLDADGRIAYLHAGYGGGLERNLAMVLDELLAQASK